jgi:signal peptidase II
VDARRRGAAIALFATALGTWALDRTTKAWAEAVLPGDPVDVVPGALTLRFTENSGGAFSIGRSAPWFFVGVSGIVSLVIVLTAFRHTSRLVGVALGLVLGGALGNLTDRAIRGPAFRGRVVDFVDLHVWPVFNLADAGIVAGAIALALAGARDRGREQRDAPAEPARPG